MQGRGGGSGGGGGLLQSKDISCYDKLHLDK